MHYIATNRLFTQYDFPSDFAVTNHNGTSVKEFFDHELRLVVLGHVLQVIHCIQKQIMTND